MPPPPPLSLPLPFSSPTPTLCHPSLPPLRANVYASTSPPLPAFYSHLPSHPYLARASSHRCLSLMGEEFTSPSAAAKCGGGNTIAMAVVEDGLEASGIEESDDELTNTGNGDKATLPLPPAFLEFLKQNQIDPSVYEAAHSLPRYIRLKHSAEATMDEILYLQNEITKSIKQLSWLPGFFYVAPEVNIAGSKAYKDGKIYGMDASSGAAVLALDVSPQDHVLDICAAPGAKLCMIADSLGVGGTLTGVDISRERLAACRTMLQKYMLGNRCRLFLADGTTFSLMPCVEPGATSIKEKQTADTNYSQSLQSSCLPSNAENKVTKRNIRCTGDGSAVLSEWTSRKTRKEKRAERRARMFNKKGLHECGIQRDEQSKMPEIFFYGRESGMLGMELSEVLTQRNITDEDFSRNGYDKVLVDAECTHDGSLKHIIKFEQWGWDTFEQRFFNAERMSSITELQLKLLSNGFRLLKCGGSLIYSTCSFTLEQNEGVIERFLATQANAELSQIEASKGWPCRAGGLMHTLRFDPFVSSTNGLFIAKIVKTSLLTQHCG